MSWQSSLMMCYLLPMTISSNSLPLLLVSTSCHVFDRALLSIDINRPLPLEYCNIVSDLCRSSAISFPISRYIHSAKCFVFPLFISTTTVSLSESWFIKMASIDLLATTI
jgi:hypothetical protein